MRAPTTLTLALLLLAQAVPAQEVKPGTWPTAGKIPAGWVVHNTKYYHVQSQCGLEKAKRLGAHMEVMQAVYRNMFRPDKGGTKLQTIKLFKDEATYHNYGGPQGAAAYFSPSQHEMVCYDSGKWSDEVKTEAAVTGQETPLDRIKRRRSRFLDMMTMDLLGTAAHEGWHQYFDWYVGSQVELPSWINEGMGDYFYAASPKREPRKTKRYAATLGNMNDGRLWVIQVAQQQKLMVPLERFVSMLQRDYYSNPDVCYAQGWAFCQFLLHGENGKYGKIIPTYVRLIKDDSNWKVVTGKAFKGVDFATMDTEFQAFVGTMQPSVPDPMEEDDEPEMPVDGEPAPAPPGEDPPAGGPPADGPPPGGDTPPGR